MRINFGKAAIAALGMSLLAAGISSGQVQMNIPAAQDATLLGGSDATTNQSLADPGLFVGTDGQDNPKRSLIEFNIAQALPAGATITAVQLQLTVGQVAGSGGGSSGGSSTAETISLFNETQTWGQPTNVAGSTSFGGTGHGGTPKNGDATWNYAFYNSTPALGTLWSVAGGNWTSSSTDIADASVTGTDGATFDWSSAAMVADVQNWLNNPSDNFGWLVKNADETDATDFRAFWSAQGAAADSDPAIAPDLLVTYTPVPEPLGFSLLAVGLPILLLRRRRRTRHC